MPLKLIVTKDGSHTIQGAGGVTYHSTFGALQESMHIFIDAGLRVVAAERAQTGGQKEPIRIFELGLGTGLNALLSLLEAVDTGRQIIYEAVETSPLPLSLIHDLNYCRLLAGPEWEPIFEQLHTSSWDTPNTLHPTFTIFKTLNSGQGYLLRQPADLVYYDAFDPVTQPELWTAEVFEGLYQQLAPGALLITYSCKGSVQRALTAVGFLLEKLPGPPGKREILRARKPKQT